MVLCFSVVWVRVVLMVLGWFVCAAPGISASPSEENMRYFNVMILGPAQSPYEGTAPDGYVICCRGCYGSRWICYLL